MKIYFAILLSMMSSMGFAKTSADIFTGSSNANISMTRPLYDNYKTRFSFAFGYDHAFSNGLQLGSDIAAVIGTGYNPYSIMIGPGFNFNSEDLENSFFIALKGGVVIVNYGGYTATDARAYIEIAKRFKLAENVSFVPGVLVEKVFGPNSEDPAIQINLFKFSLLF